MLQDIHLDIKQTVHQLQVSKNFFLNCRSYMGFTIVLGKAKELADKLDIIASFHKENNSRKQKRDWL